MERYEKYKDSGVEWIGEIPEGWAVKKFKYLYALITDKSDLDLPKIGLENIESETGKFITSNTDFEGGGIHFKINDILFGKLRPYLAKVYLAEFEGKAIGDFYVFRCENEIDARYSSNLILSKPFIDLSNSSTFGSKMPRVAWDIIANFKIAYPSLTEQTTIANYLDHKTTEIDQLITQKEHLLSLYEEEKTAIINQAVTQGITPDVKLKESGIDWLGDIPEHWEVKKLKYIGAIKYGLGQPPKLNPNGLPLIRATNVFRGVIDEKNMIFVDPHDVPYDRDPVLKEFDIIVVRSGAYTADSAIIPKEYEGAITGYDMVFRTNQANCPDFISFILLSNYVLNNQLIPLSLRAAQPHLNKEELGETLVHIPPLSEQITIARHIKTELTRINTKITKTKKIITLQKEYRTALISEVVTGKIKVTNLDYKEIIL